MKTFNFNFIAKNLYLHSNEVFTNADSVPLVVNWPGKIKLSYQNTHFICLINFMANAAEVRNVTLSDNAAEDSKRFLAEF